MTAPCDLHRVYGDVTRRVPDGPPGNADFLFTTDALPIPPSELTTNRILIRRFSHNYNSWYRADLLWMYLNAEICRELGVFLMACAFHGPTDDVTLKLNPESQVQRIKVRANPRNLSDLYPGLTMIPFAFRYFPQ